MFKCSECGKKISYGRKISCCDLNYFGIIFSDRRSDHKWNCMSSLISAESSPQEVSKIAFFAGKKPVQYDWNCNPSSRSQVQKSMEMEFIYE